MQTLVKGDKFEKPAEGELYNLSGFIKQVNAKTILPESGSISEVVVDGSKTNIAINGWSWYTLETKDKLFHMPLEGLGVPAKFGINKPIQIVWVPKKKVEPAKESVKI